MRPRIVRDPTVVGTYPLSQALVLTFRVPRRYARGVYDHGEWNHYSSRPCITPRAKYRNVDATRVLDNLFKVGGYYLKAIRVHRNGRSSQVNILLIRSERSRSSSVPVMLDDINDLLQDRIFEEVRIHAGLSFSTLCFYGSRSKRHVSTENELDFEDGRVMVADDMLEYEPSEGYMGAVQ